jgi:UDP-N-acetylglucosamine 2-epimerase (non-hydrolysing)
MKITEIPLRRPKDHRVTKVLSLFGTRPEVIKLAPVIHQLERFPESFQTVNVASGQHTDLLCPFIDMFGLRVDHNLNAMEVDQKPSVLFARILQSFTPILEWEHPDLILVQGDTTTALAGAFVGFHHHVPVGHIEAGLRSGNINSPYPEEMNRTLITPLATYHFAATPGNRDLLQREGVTPDKIFLTGNPVVDALHSILELSDGAESFADTLLFQTQGLKRIVLTTHRRESFGETIAANLRTLCRFVEEHEDVALLFPVHSNPNVQGPAEAICKGAPRVFLTKPLNYRDFIRLLSNCWLIVSDSGGVQEEAPSLGKPLLILRDNTERPESVEAGIARLVGGRATTLRAMLEEAYQEGSWAESVSEIHNPFGCGDSAELIVDTIARLFRVETIQSAMLGD